MPQPIGSEITRILLELERPEPGRPDAVGRLFTAVYGELHRMAAGFMSHERPDHTLQPTALVNETYLRLVDANAVDWKGRAHFFGVAASAMREILVDHARRRGAEKRGGDWERVEFDEASGIAARTDVELLDLDRALTRLAEMDERMGRVVELRVFGGLEVREIAHLLAISERTVENDWRVARMWLARELAGGDVP